MNLVQAQRVSGWDGTRQRRILDSLYAAGLHGRTREISPRQLPTNHDHAGGRPRSIHEYQSDQPSNIAAPAAVPLRLTGNKRQNHRIKVNDPLDRSFHIRVWTCGECGTVHDRDVNAAKNIPAAGRRRLAEEIPALSRRGRTSTVFFVSPSKVSDGTRRDFR